MKPLHYLLLAAASASSALGAVAYTNDLSKSEPGKMPEEFLVLDGNFEVKEERGNRFVELPGAPLESFGFQFGPTEKENIAVSARFFSTNKGRRFNTFSVACNGVSGFRLNVAPAKKAIELFRGETLLGSVPYDWKTGKWTTLRIEQRKVSDSKWAIQGYAWQEGEAQPKEPLISAEQETAPPNGRASVYGMPYAGTPIRFDDLKVEKLEG